MKKKRICFLVFGVGKANGGHYRSLVTVAEAMSEKFEVLIINLGYIHSNIIRDSKLDSKYIFFNGLNTAKPIRGIVDFLQNQHVDVFHSFDYQSLLIGKLLSSKLKTPVLFTKCGGASPHGYYPFNHYLTLFSTEDFNYFTNNGRYSSAEIKLIPNRISEFECDQEKINALKKRGSVSDELILLRICRIGNYYSKSIKQAINLTRALSDQGVRVKLFIVGNIQDENVLEELKKDPNSNLFTIVTESVYTRNAKEVIDIADFVIGTGRGFMEASSKSKVMLCPSLQGDLPILIDQSTFQSAFDKNFSERVDFPIDPKNDNWNRIMSLFSETKKISDHKKESFENYLTHFSIIKGALKYGSLYEKMSYLPTTKKDLLNHRLFVIKKSMGIWFRNLKYTINGEN